MISTRTKDKLQRTIDKRDNFYVNRSKNFSIDKGEKYIRESELSGITLLALVVTIIVLLILAGVTISTINSNNGVLTQAKKATITSDLSKYKEEVELYKASKQMEGTEKKTADGKRFEATSLNANYQEKSLVYNTQDGNETGDITTIIPDLKKDYHDGKRDNGEISVTNGQMVFKSTNDELYKIAQDLGIEVDPYNVKIEKDSDGKDVAVLTSSNKNLLLISEDGTVTLPYDIDVIDQGTFANVKGLKKIIIPYTVKEIRSNAFSYNSDIQEIEFQTKNNKDGTIEGCETISSYAFRQCTNLEKIILPDSITFIGDWVFQDCTKLNSVNIPNGLTYLSHGMFFGCTNLTNINLSDNITALNSQCLQGIGLNEITIPSSVTVMSEYCLCDCKNLKKITILGNNTSISDVAFWNSDNIVNITINNNALNILKWADSNTLMNSKINKVIFIYPTYLSSIKEYKIPDGITEWNYPMSSYQIEKLIFPSSLTTLGVYYTSREIKEFDLSQNTNFKILTTDNGKHKMLCDNNNNLIYYLKTVDDEITIPNTINTANFYSIQAPRVKKIIINCKNINNKAIEIGFSTIKIGENVQSINQFFAADFWNYTMEVDSNNNKYAIKNGLIFEKSENEDTYKVLYSYEKPTKGNPITINIPSELYNKPVNEIGYGCFWRQWTIQEMSIPESIKKIGGSAFNGCSSLKKISIPSSVTSIGAGTFSDCRNLDEININRNKDSILGAPWGATKGEKVMKWANS